MLSHFLQSFRYALKGLRYVFKEEANFSIQSLATILVIIAGWYFDVSSTEWLFLILAIALVLGSEILNTILEDICDELEPNYHPVVGKAKDMMAALVLLNASVALVIGLTIFLPRLF